MESNLFARMNFSLSAADPDETPKTFAPFFLKSGALFSKAQA
jgi:hypothetical protein